ncbi:MAG: hypothetical protein IPH99_08950 [Xanthomonadales bacterium]|nr:hypothetical protein [Xanthomonadales bacterium]
MNASFVRCTLATLFFAGTLGVAHAAPLTFNFTFDDPASTAQAVGSITFEDSLLLNPGTNDFVLPNPAVLALNVTVSGSASGNGTFTLADFNEVVFDTFGGTLDFGSQLVGQPTSGGSWGTPDGNSGDFNLFSGTMKGPSRYPAPPSAPTGAIAPDGVFYFTLGANGGAGEPMELVGMGVTGGATAPATLPIDRGAWFALAGLLGLVGLLAFRRRAVGH